VGFGKGPDAMAGIKIFARTAEQGAGETARALVRCHKAYRSVEVTGAYSAQRQSRMNREHPPKIEEILHARLPKRGAFSDWRYQQGVRHFEFRIHILNSNAKQWNCEQKADK
jgi:hypothetical protein